MRVLLSYIIEHSKPRQSAVYFRPTDPRNGEKELEKVVNKARRYIDYDKLKELISAYVKFISDSTFGVHMPHLHHYIPTFTPQFRGTIYAGLINNTDHLYTRKYCEKELVDDSFKSYALVFCTHDNIWIDIKLDGEFVCINTNNGDTRRYLRADGMFPADLEPEWYRIGIVKNTRIHNTGDIFDLFLIPISSEMPIDKEYGFYVEVDGKKIPDIRINPHTINKLKRRLSPLASVWLEKIVSTIGSSVGGVELTCQGDTTPDDYLDVFDEMIAATKKVEEDELSGFIFYIKTLVAQGKFGSML